MVICPVCDGLGVVRASHIIGNAIRIPNYKAPAETCSACNGSGRIRPLWQRRGSPFAALNELFALAR